MDISAWPIWAAIEQIGFVRAFAVANWAYPVVSALHIAALGTLFGLVLIMDTLLLRQRIHADLPTLHRAALLAFTVAALSGLLLFSVRASDYVINPAFQAKIALIACAGVNMLALHVHRLRTSGASWSSLQSWPLTGVIAALSLVLWCCIVLAGRMIAFLK
jgi:high-affinity Fe2+/Pb2+ permease